MEDVQFAEPLPEEVDEPMASMEEPPATSEEPKGADSLLPQTEAESFPDITPPNNTVEVAIREKPEVEAEDPIFPDHYYDDGNIPVFKPVTHHLRTISADILRQWTNFAILKSSSTASTIME
jgi:hypothetical protein